MNSLEFDSQEFIDDAVPLDPNRSVESVVLLAALHHNHNGEVSRTLQELRQQEAGDHEIAQIIGQRFPPWEVIA